MTSKMDRIKTLEARLAGLKLEARRAELAAQTRASKAARAIEMTLPSKNVSLVECLNSDKENGNDECETGTLHA